MSEFCSRGGQLDQSEVLGVASFPAGRLRPLRDWVFFRGMEWIDNRGVALESTKSTNLGRCKSIDDGDGARKGWSEVEQGRILKTYLDSSRIWLAYEMPQHNAAAAALELSTARGRRR